MNHRERVLAALDHREPDRVPVDFGSYPGATSINVFAYEKLKKYLDLAVGQELKIANIPMFTAEVDEAILDRFDIDTCSATPSTRLNDFNAPASFQDRWKVTWQKTDADTYSPVGGPFFKENGHLDALKAFDWPKPQELEDGGKWVGKVQGLRQKTDRALVAKLPLGFVTLTQMLRGFEDWFADLYLNRAFFDALMDRCAEIWAATAQRLVEAVGNDIDIFVWGDDYGFQNGPMLSPKLFREVVASRYKPILKTIKKTSKAKILLHSCGSVFDYLDDFLEMGIDALNPIQVSAKNMDPNKIKDQFGDRLTLWGAIGIDDLVEGTPAKVKDLVRRRIDDLNRGGGYVLSATHNLLSDVPLENIVAMFEAVKEY